jgi:alpha/beta superfamily hydrolase
MLRAPVFRATVPYARFAERRMTRLEEKATVIAVPGRGDLVLEGIYIRGDGAEAPGALVAPPHPLYGGSMTSPVVGEVAWACQRAGYATLRFEWRGVGASSGSPSGESADADADYAAALAHLADTVSGPLLAGGYSFGAAAALRVAVSEPRVRRLVLVAPPAAMLDARALAAFRGQALLLTGEHDGYAPPSALEALLADAERCTLEVIPGADHFFQEGLASISRAVASWLGAGRER